MSGFEPVRPDFIDPNVAAQAEGEVRHGTQDGPPSVRMLGGYFIFDSEDSGLLVSLLPGQVHIRGVDRLSTLVKLLIDEAAEQRSGRELVLSRLVEVLLVVSFRLTPMPTRPQDCCAVWAMCGWRKQSGRYMPIPIVPGLFLNSRKRLRCRTQLL